jgi:hypothetical protein
MGSYLSLLDESPSTRLASPDVCDDTTWENTLRNRSSFTVYDHLEIHAATRDALGAFDDEPILAEPRTPETTRRKRLGFAPDVVRVFDAEQPASHVSLRSPAVVDSESDDDSSDVLIVGFL